MFEIVANIPWQAFENFELNTLLFIKLEVDLHNLSEKISYENL